jgi:hypothetical protein
VAFIVARIRQRDWLPVFCLAWFAIVLAPVLPLRDHFSSYYLVLPSIGLAMLAGYALASAWRLGVAWGAAAALLAAAYAVPMIIADRFEMRWLQDRSIAIQRMVLGVARAHQLHPAETILLDGVDEQLFRAGMYHHPFSVVGVTSVYLTPGSAGRIGPLDVRVENYELSSGPTVHGLDHNQIVVYKVGGRRLKAVTATYINTAAQKLDTNPPHLVELASPLFAYLLGPEWYAPEEGFRWMPRRATLRLGGPRTRSQRLYLNGFCSPAELRAAPMPVRVWLDGTLLGELLVRNGGNPFHASLPIPDQLVGKKQVEIAVEAGRTFRAGLDERQLSLAFSSFEIR